MKAKPAGRVPGFKCLVAAFVFVVDCFFVFLLKDVSGTGLDDPKIIGKRLGKGKYFSTFLHAYRASIRFLRGALSFSYKSNNRAFFLVDDESPTVQVEGKYRCQCGFVSSLQLVHLKMNFIPLGMVLSHQFEKAVFMLYSIAR